LEQVKVLQYKVIDALAILLPSLAGPVYHYAKPGTEGLLEDFLTRKGFMFYEPEEVEKPADFSNFTIVFMPYAPMIDLSNGALVAQLKTLEPSLN
jgi:hypothetical protein